MFTHWITKLLTASTFREFDGLTFVGTLDAVPIQHGGNASTNIAFFAY